MYVVAITRWGRPLEQEVAALAPLLGMVPYDLKLRLAGPLPVVFAREAEADGARRHLAALRDRGHGAVACDLGRVPCSAEMASPRRYGFEPAAFVGSDPAWGERRMPYADMVGLIHASAATIEQQSSVTKKRKFSLGRAALTGGLAMRKTVTTERRATSEQREQVLYVIRKDASDPWLLQEGRLRHQGLGDRVRPTSAENFATLIEVLRERAPAALYDDRLRRRTRKADSLSVSGTTAHKVTEMSNASETDLAMHLIVVAHLTGQL
ncbi:MAG: hypothetical protein JRI23_00925 [Deltaproteobacteria bacterium]|jgi:hypothetical protein|nr:hypothetical protein [Deltaproteobacteria bacterium]MBW2530016.1 hypothetical protein [Deltaproteobacteria bacterium]